jgi:1-acyl-sn-glycerol-3-phosphate acyltransferase
MKLDRLGTNLYCWLLFTVVTLAFGLLLPLIIAVRVIFQGRSFGPTLRLAIRKYGWFLLRLLSPAIPVTVENRAGALPLPAVFVANHSSAIDPFLFGLLAIENAFITSWPFRLPIYGSIMRMAGYIDARSGWPEIETSGKILLDAGCSLTVWPEGHRSRNGRLGRFRKGAFKLAVAAGRPVVPVCILGAGELLPPGRKLLTAGRIKMILLPPISLKDEGDGAITPEHLLAEARRSIGRELRSWQGKQEVYHKVPEVNAENISF